MNCIEWKQRAFKSRHPRAVWAVVFNKSHTNRPEVIPLTMTAYTPPSLQTTRVTNEGRSLFRPTQSHAFTEVNKLHNKQRLHLQTCPILFPLNRCPPHFGGGSLSLVTHNRPLGQGGGAGGEGVMSVCALFLPASHGPMIATTTLSLGVRRKGEEERHDETTMRGGWCSVAVRSGAMRSRGALSPNKGAWPHAHSSQHPTHIVHVWWAGTGLRGRGMRLQQQPGGLSDVQVLGRRGGDEWLTPHTPQVTLRGGQRVAATSASNQSCLGAPFINVCAISVTRSWQASGKR